MEVAKLLSDVSRLKKMVAAKDAQIEALNSRCETLEDDVLEARSERDRLRQAVAQLEQQRGASGSTHGSQPAPGEASASEALQQRVDQAEARAAAAAECAADAQASLAAAMDDFERDLEQREQSQYAQALREQAERTLMLGELARLERAVLDGRSHPPDRSASTQRYLEESIPKSSRDQALVASLVEELGKMEAANDALRRRQLELEESARLEIEELRDQLIQQTEMELHALEDPCTRGPRTASLSAPHRSYGVAKEDGSTSSYGVRTTKPVEPPSEEQEAAGETELRSRWTAELHRAGVSGPMSATSRAIQPISCPLYPHDASTQHDGRIIELPSYGHDSVVLLAPPPKVEPPAPSTAPARSSSRTHPPLHHMQHPHQSPRPRMPVSASRQLPPRQPTPQSTGTRAPPATGDEERDFQRQLTRQSSKPLHHGGSAATPTQIVPPALLPGVGTTCSKASSRRSATSTRSCSEAACCSATPLQSSAKAASQSKSVGRPEYSTRQMLHYSTGTTDLSFNEKRNQETREQIRQSQAHIKEMLRAQESALRAVADL